VRKNLACWLEEGLVPDMPIEAGENTTQPVRERGWTHWLHLFSARQILLGALVCQLSNMKPGTALGMANFLDRTSKLCRLDAFGGNVGREAKVQTTFYNQALNTMSTYAVRSGNYSLRHLVTLTSSRPVIIKFDIEARDAKDTRILSDLFVTDPPYADAVNYHEITEFFIAWLRKNPPQPFDQWSWDSHRNLAIKGRDQHFRRDMVPAYGAMTRRMPDNGLQVVMFTHQDAGVWADLGAILWAAGLHVTSAWNVVTETESALKEGNYVQGTVCLVLRKRMGEANARRMEIEAEIEEAVAAQLARLTALDDSWHERSNAETLYTDGDLALAAYAAALQVVTAYSSIDRQPLDRDLYRQFAKGETTMLRELVDYAAQIANGLPVPKGFPRDMWRDLGAPERFLCPHARYGGAGLGESCRLPEFRKELRVRRLRFTDGLDRRQRRLARRCGRP
jgi:putative DNA methylase